MATGFDSNPRGDSMSCLLFVLTAPFDGVRAIKRIKFVGTSFPPLVATELE
jgi:hypothetical protein